MKNIFLLITMTLLFEATTFAQNISINTTGAAADASAALDISSSSTGLLIPRMTTTQRNAIASPATGLMIYNSTTGGFEYYNGSTWASLMPSFGTMAKADSTSYHGSTSINTVGTITSGTWNGSPISITNGGTGQTTANAALNAFLPSQSGNNGKFLKTDGTNTSWAVGPYRTYVNTTSDQAFAATTWTDVTGLSFTVTAGTVYKFSAVIPFVNVGGGGDVLDFSVSGPASPTFYSANIIISKTATDLERGSSSAYDTGVNPAGDIVGSNLAQIDGVFIASASGTFVIRAKSNKANKHTIKTGASLEYW